MRFVRQAATDLAWPSLHHAKGRLLGLPFVVAASAPGLVSGWTACATGLMITSLISFVVYVPLTALALNGGDALAEDSPVPPLTPRAYWTLLLLWTATAWLTEAVLPPMVR